jgi:mannobiose 2-epimerase
VRRLLRRVFPGRVHLAAQHFDDPVGADAGFAEAADACRRMLRESFVDFYLRSLDEHHGGFLDALDDRGAFAPAPTRIAVFQLRQFWFFSALLGRGIGGEPVRAAARHGFDYFQSCLWDAVDGGVPISVAEDGRVEDGRKHVYVQTLALHALATYSGATKTPEAFGALERCWDVIEHRTHDAEHGGYIEWFEQDWTPLLDPASTYIGCGAQKTFGAHMHILEAFTELYRVQPAPLLRERIEELMTLMTDTFPASEGARCLDRFEPDWTPAESEANGQVSYGHELEAAWFLVDAAAAIRVPDGPYLRRARAITDMCTQHGYDRKHGGFYYTGPPGGAAADTRKFSWVQAEAMSCLLVVYRRTRQPEDYATFLETLRFTGRELVVPEGGSWAITLRDGRRPREATRTGHWEGGYHMGRALLMCAEILEQLAAGAGGRP